MKITTDQKKKAPADKNLTEVIFSDTTQTKFVESKDGTVHIEMKVPKGKTIPQRKLIIFTRKIVQVAKQYKVKGIKFDFQSLKEKTDLSDEAFASVLTQNLLLANYEFRDFKTKPKSGWSDVERVRIFNISKKGSEGAQKGVQIGEMVNECRSICNIPGGDMTPTSLAKHAKRLSQGTKVKVTVLGEKEMEKLKMGAILGVSKGSSEDSKFIIMEYAGGKKSEKPIVLIGKGVTFDTGGLSLKPSEAQLGMHLDMSGGGAVMATVALSSKLGIKKNIIGLIPAVENMVSGASVRPGDVLTSMSGKTIEVVNTDAEGRLILADALTYAKRYNPRLVIDIATLTGASLVALGQKASAIMTRDITLQNLLCELGEESGDYVWPLPLWEEYEDDIKGNNVADIANLSVKNARYGGAINGGIFLQQFAKDYLWVHIDMAPRMTSANGDSLASGATGEPIRLLIKLVERF